MPDENLYTCEEIADSWKDIYKCVSKARCDDENYGAGLIVGHCVTLHNYYRWDLLGSDQNIGFTSYQPLSF